MKFCNSWVESMLPKVCSVCSVVQGISRHLASTMGVCVFSFKKHRVIYHWYKLISQNFGIRLQTIVFTKKDEYLSPCQANMSHDHFIK